VRPESPVPAASKVPSSDNVLEQAALAAGGLGAFLIRDASTGKIMVRIDGLDEALTVQQATERKFIKVSWA